jgi:hypothetical protein
VTRRDLVADALIVALAGLVALIVWWDASVPSLPGAAALAPVAAVAVLVGGTVAFLSAVPAVERALDDPVAVVVVVAAVVVGVRTLFPAGLSLAAEVGVLLGAAAYLVGRVSLCVLGDAWRAVEA